MNFELKKSKIHNSWRAIRHTKKGKRIGNDERWDDYCNFYSDVEAGWVEGYRLVRIDKNKKFSKENYRWEDPKNMCNHRLSKLTYNGETKTLDSWCKELNLNYMGVRLRYFRINKTNKSAEEILFGRKNKIRIKKEESPAKIRASKLVSSYRIKDRRSCRDNDITVEWFLENISGKKCTYCGTTLRIGCDRVDNSIGHIKSNCIPACSQCNSIRGNRFTVEQMVKIGKFISENIMKCQEFELKII